MIWSLNRHFQLIFTSPATLRHPAPAQMAVSRSFRTYHPQHQILRLSSSSCSTLPFLHHHHHHHRTGTRLLTQQYDGRHEKSSCLSNRRNLGARQSYSDLALTPPSSVLTNPNIRVGSRRAGSSDPLNQTTKSIISYRSDRDGLSVQFHSGGVSKFHHIWLRDNCRCEKCFHPHTRQRLLDTLQIPLDIQPARIGVEAEGFSIDWSDGHRSDIAFSFLRRYSYDPPINGSNYMSRQQRSRKVLWDHTIVNCMPSVSYKDIFSSDEQTWRGDFYVLDWLRKIDKFGFCLVDHVPPNPEDTEKLLRRIAFIRETHYGAFWDFTADMKHGDTAYTSIALGAHTDTTYFSDPAGLQMFHLLSPPTSHEGGKSLLVDGFRAAAKLREENPVAYKVLSEMPIESHASGGADVAFRPIFPQPVFSHHPCTRELMMIRWNPDDRKPITGRSGQEVKNLYHALREWEKIVKSEEMELWTQMKMGQALIFDNHRVLHGRSSFKGSRRLCGGYINRDDYRSRLISLERKLLACSRVP